MEEEKILAKMNLQKSKFSDLSSRYKHFSLNMLNYKYIKTLTEQCVLSSRTLVLFIDSHFYVHMHLRRTSE